MLNTFQCCCIARSLGMAATLWRRLLRFCSAALCLVLYDESAGTYAQLGNRLSATTHCIACRQCQARKTQVRVSSQAKHLIERLLCGNAIGALTSAAALNSAALPTCACFCLQLQLISVFGRTSQHKTLLQIMTPCLRRGRSNIQSGQG